MTARAIEIQNADLYTIPIPIADRWLLFSPQTWATALVNRSAIMIFARFFAGDHVTLPDNLQELWNELTYNPVPGTTWGDVPDKLVVMPTRACNIHCVYCDFAATNSPTEMLDSRLACFVIDHFARQLSAMEHKTLRVHFFGGEPMVARWCIETIVHYVRSLCAKTGNFPWFEVTTNGLFDIDAVQFMGDYIDSVVISLDGSENLHDYNRRHHDGGGTYAEVAANIRRLSRFPVELCLRMCVTNRSVSSMESLTEKFCNDFEFDVLSFESLIENENGRRSGLSSPDPYAFAAGVLKAEAVASKKGVRVVHGPSELIGPRTTSCPLGKGTLMLSPEGQLTACYLNPQRWMERGLDLVIGHVDPTAGVFLDHRKLESVASLVYSKPRCTRCFCRYTCAGGCHVDQTPPGCSLDYDNRCRAIRVITAGRLLRNLGFEEETEILASRLSEMVSIADRPDDRLESWKDVA